MGETASYKFDTDCPDCIAARLRMKAEGFRNWRTAYACYDHAAVDWDEWCAANPPADADDQPDQPDLFASVAA